MAYEENARVPAKLHSLQLEGREKLSLSGVEDVTGFDESLIVLSTAQGELSIRGEQLHIGRIDLDAGELEVCGSIRELSYSEAGPARSLWARLFS